MSLQRYRKCHINTYDKSRTAEHILSEEKTIQLQQLPYLKWSLLSNHVGSPINMTSCSLFSDQA